MYRRVKIGSIVEVETARGLCYLHVTHRHKKWGWLVVAFDSFAAARPDNFADLRDKSPAFKTFFSVQAAVNEGLVCLTGAQLDCDDPFPLFRCRAGGPGGAWWLWDGEKEWMLPKHPIFGHRLPRKYRALPYRSMPSFPLLVEWLENGHRVEYDRV